MTTLRKGSRGQDVKTLQQKLHLIADGIFGPLTDEAVREFQKKNGLVVDGIVGPKTWAALGETVPNTRRIDKIIIHCSATPEGENFTVEQIRQIHLERGFSDIGYHYVIYRDGTVHAGHPESISGAHCTGQNSHSIGVCYIGGCPPRTDPKWMNKGKDTRTDAQKDALQKIIANLRNRYPGATIHGHNEFANKACPSFDVRKEYKDLF